MLKISPASLPKKNLKALKQCNKSINKAFEINLNNEELGIYKFGDRFVKQIFPR